MQIYQKKGDIIEINVKSSEASDDDLATKSKELIRAKRNNFADKTFDEWMKIRATVYELEVKNGTLSCSCPLGMKHNFCKHKVGLMIKLKMITALKML